MSYQVLPGRVAGVIEIHYACPLTATVREAAVAAARALAGDSRIPVVIADFSQATLAMDVSEARQFHERWSADESPDCKLLIYATARDKAHFEQEVAIGYEFGRMIVVVDSVDAAYAMLADLEKDG
jgi:hypothetical protein